MSTFLSYQETLHTLQRFYIDNIAYWESQGKTPREAHCTAIQEVAQATHDPFVPNGQCLNADAQADFHHAHNK